jgi:hypothetical protein
MRACFVSQGNIFGFGYDRVAGFMPSGSASDAVFLRWVCCFERYAKRAIAIAEPTNNPVATVTSSSFSLCDRIIPNSCLVENALSTPKTKQSVIIWESPRYHLTQAPATQITSSGDIPQPSATKQGASERRLEVEKNNKP